MILSMLTHTGEPARPAVPSGKVPGPTTYTSHVHTHSYTQGTEGLREQATVAFYMNIMMSKQGVKYPAALHYCLPSSVSLYMSPAQQHSAGFLLQAPKDVFLFSYFPGPFTLV